MISYIFAAVFKNATIASKKSIETRLIHNEETPYIIPCHPIVRDLGICSRNQDRKGH